jgi:hypothetical protein
MCHGCINEVKRTSNVTDDVSKTFR